MSTPAAVFGPGILIATRTDITPGPPINVGYVQEFSMEIAGTTKQLYGQYQFPLAQARATIKATGKFKAATVSGYAMNTLFYGLSLSTASQLAWNIDSTFTLSTTSSAIQVGSSLTFDQDLGVKYAASGLPLQRVSTGSEAVGKYSITTGSPGLYNFAVGDELAGGTPLKITFTNTQSTSGQSLIVTNQLIGNTPTFQLDYYTALNQPTNKPFAIRIYEAISEKQMMQFKLEDFMIPEWDFSFFANASGQVFDIVLPEQS